MTSEGNSYQDSNESLYKSSLDQNNGETDESYLQRLWYLQKALLEHYEDITVFQDFDSEDKRQQKLLEIKGRLDPIDEILKPHRYPAQGFNAVKIHFEERLEDCTGEEVSIWVLLGELHAFKHDDLIGPLAVSELDYNLTRTLLGLFFDPLEIQFFDPYSPKSQGRWLTYEKLLERWEKLGEPLQEVKDLIESLHQEWKGRTKGVGIVYPEFKPYGFHPKTDIAENPEKGMYNLRQIEEFEKEYFKQTSAASSVKKSNKQEEMKERNKNLQRMVDQLHKEEADLSHSEICRRIAKETDYVDGSIRKWTKKTW